MELQRKKQASNHLLALLFFALAIRISKSVIIIMFPESSDILPAIGLVGMAAIGPFLYLYIQSLHIESFALDIQKWFHFLPSASLIFALPIPFVDEMIIYRFYQFVVAQILVYLILSFRLHSTTSQEVAADSLKTKWGYILLAGVTLIWTAFFAQLIADTFMLYLVATSIAAFVLYGVSFWVMKNRLVFKDNARLYKMNGNAHGLYKKIMHALETEKIYKDIDLTINKLAEAIKGQSYLVSLVINEKFQKAFLNLLIHIVLKKPKKCWSHKRLSTLVLSLLLMKMGLIQSPLSMPPSKMSVTQLLQNTEAV